MLESADSQRTAKIIKTWMLWFEKCRVGDSDDEATFLASLARVLLKKDKLFASFFTSEDMKKLRRYLILAFVLLSELERGSKFFEGAMLFVLFEFCLDELPLHLRGRYGIMNIFLRDHFTEYKMDSILKNICKQLTDSLSSQLITNAAADLVASLVARFPTSSDILSLFVENLMQHVKCIRWNILRWFGRIDISKEGCQFLFRVRDLLREKFAKVDEDLWPPLLFEIEDVSCIDPLWNCNESEELLWEADRALDAYLKVSNTLQQRFHQEIDKSDPRELYVPALIHSYFYLVNFASLFVPIVLI
ncbi:unnamed protein product [Strongylus vulgaris]|uniref:Uncharacterized protein n=1 Tax=Strongylus vulgaris TaxID=40348 RepID=A0A3P7KCG3_STRVU|nr:unnamed protein product [Strongylus vulgaris]